MSLLSQVFTFAKNPTLEIANLTSTRNKIWNIIQLWAFFALLAFSLGFLQDPFLNAVGYELKDHAVTHALTSENPLLFILGASAIAPIVEEVTFRLWLRPTHRNLAFSLGFLTTILSSLLVAEFATKLSFLRSLGSNFSVLLFAFFGPYLVFALLFYLILGNIKIFTKVSGFLSKYFRVFFYFATALFASAHLTNYDPSKVWFLTPILVLPQFIVGFYLGFVRLNYGFKWSVIAHALHNSILVPFVVALGLVSQSTKEVLLSGSENTNLLENLPAGDTVVLSVAGIFMIFEIVLILGLAIQLVVEWFLERRKRLVDNLQN